MGRSLRKYTDDYKAAAVERLYEPGATQGSVAKELGFRARNRFSVPARRRSALTIRHHRMEAFDAWNTAANVA